MVGRIMTTKKHGGNPPKSVTERQDDFRARHAEAGRKEVRGIYATPENAVKIKAYANSIRGN